MPVDDNTVIIGPAQPRYRNMAEAPPVKPPTRALVRRGTAVRIAKYALPVVALALLSSIALWPEISRTIEHGRVTWHRLSMIDTSGGLMRLPRYRGFDDQNQPYMVSAEAAVQVGPDRYNLRAPRGDVTTRSGTWLQVQSKTGVYAQHENQLDLQGNVTLYKQDGTILITPAATMDMKQGVATSSAYTHAEGPFGTLDAEGFTLVDKGGIVQFHGPAKLVLNAAN
jgi:lipopolysaccharide export system protein LptC